MTYKQLIDTLSQIITSHRLINQWGYGNISDIETPETGAPNYPYVFINPVQVQIQSYGFDTTLNLIVMDQPLATVDAEIDAASRALGLVQDIIGQFKLTTLYQETDVTLSVSCIPFKERFKDSVVGVTATITFEVNEPLDVCDAPFPEYDMLVHVTNTADYEVGTDSGENKSFTFTNEIVDVESRWNTTSYNLPQAGRYKFQLDLVAKFDEPDVLEQLISQPLIKEAIPGPDNYYPPTTISFWPTTITDPNAVYNIQAVWELDLTEVGALEFIGPLNQSATPMSNMWQLVGSSLKIWRAN